MNKKNQNLVIIFAKKPEAGTTKTRIAVETSVSFAYEFTLACFSDLLNKIRGSTFYDLVVVTDTHEEASWFEKNYGISSFAMNLVETRKKGRNLSEKFDFVFSAMIKKYGYKKVILVPMDNPFLSEAEIAMAFYQLSEYKYIVGPEVDGGVYLIGIKAPYKENIFKDVSWSTPYSCEKLTGNMKDSADTYKLRYKNDLNTFQVVLKVKKEIELHCPELYRLLRRNGYYIPSENVFIDYDSLEIRVPITACLVEKKGRNNQPLLLVQTRYKPSTDPQHSGLMEIPGGLLDKSIPVEEAAKREVEEETGVTCEIVGLKPSQEVGGREVDGDKGERSSLTMTPFCCVQQLVGKRNYVGLIFLSRYIGGELKENYRESKNPRWITLKELKRVVEKEPEKIFSLYLPVFKKYIEFYGGS
jgi:glycosyltransferase A (GT-A) superfamily protein (DUF2064 family)/8-oxo-dGTP pyrophosphatase MutT (NUDIX family)